MQTEILDFVRALKTGSHAIFFYASPQEKHEVLFSFLQDGFEKGKGGVYIAGQETPVQIRRSMKDFGINVKALEKEGALRIISDDQWYMIDGKFETARVADLAKKVLDEAVERGFKGLNMCGETSCFFESKMERDLVQFELMWGRELNLDVTGVCVYDANQVKSLDVDLFLGLIKAHACSITPQVASHIKFDDFYLCTMEETLSNLMGSSAVRAMFWHFEQKHMVNRQKIWEDPEAFLASLEDLFGPGAAVLERAILDGLFSKIGLKSD